MGAQYLRVSSALFNDSAAELAPSGWYSGQAANHSESSLAVTASVQRDVSRKSLRGVGSGED